MNFIYILSVSNRSIEGDVTSSVVGNFQKCIWVGKVYFYICTYTFIYVYISCVFIKLYTVYTLNSYVLNL